MENNLVTFTSDKTPVVESTVIAEGIGIQHKNVIELIRKYLEDFQAFERVTFETRPFETAGGTQKREVAFLNENQAYLLFTYLKNTDTARQLKVRLVKAFSEVRNQLKDPVNALLAMSKSEILLMAAETQKKNEALEAKTLQLENKIEEDAPKVEFADGVIATGKCLCLREAIKTCGAKPKKGFDWLRLNGFIYKQSNQATQKSIDMGLMVVRFANVPHVEGVEQKPYAHVTGKGLVYFRKKFVEAGLVLSNPNLEMRI
nr:MAG TPA: KilAC domain protein [Caudoviricetes sp.]